MKTSSRVFALSFVVATLSLRMAGAETATFPGKGLAQHSFLYTGEWDHRDSRDQTIFVVRDGKVVWTYAIPFKDADGTMEELGDATMLSNGNILFCRKVGATEITPDKKIVWNIDAPKGTEIHSVQPLGLDRVLVVQNGDPAKLMIIRKATGAIEKELTLPVPHPEKPHLQFRRVRMTKDGTFLAAHLDDKKVVEYDTNGKAIWSFEVNGPWSAERLANGNTLITSYHSTVLEVNKQGEVVWQFSEKDVPEIKCFIFQEARRLANGNTVICNWCPADLKDPALWPGTVQLLEVTPDKKVVWALSQWSVPDLGPASSIQLLDETSRDLNVTTSGVVGDGVTMNTEALQKAIDACSAQGGGTAEDVKLQLPEKEAAYPEKSMFGRVLPAYGLYLRHARGVTFKNVLATLAAPDSRPEKVFVGVEGVTLADFAPYSRQRVVA